MEVGNIVEGKVTGITNFGAFVELPEGKTGMVHISEVASTYVNQITDFLTEGQTVKVKIINISDDGKISLSIKKAEPRPEREHGRYGDRNQGRRPYHDRGSQGHGGRGGFGSAPAKKDEKPSFEDMMAKFKQASDDKMSDLKKYRGEVKRGSANRKSRGN